MREKDVHNLIEQQESEAKQRIYDSIKERADFLPSAKKRSRRIKWAVLATVMTCLVVLAVVLPITLRGNKDDGTRFCDASQYQLEQVTQTLKEYSQQNKNGMLYVDWYDGAEEVLTYCAYNVNDHDDVIFLREEIILEETGYRVILLVTDNRTTVDALEFFNSCDKELLVVDIAVKWITNNVMNDTRIKFTYKNYTYYLEFDDIYDEQQISQIVDDMINK